MQNYEFSSHANQTLNGTLLSAKIPLSPALVNRLNMTIWKRIPHPLFSLH